jgi:hypothetical protein
MKRILIIIGLLQVMFPASGQVVALDTTDNFCIGAEQTISQYEDWSRPRIFDFDNDGDQDFAVTEDYADSLAVYINNGTADFTSTPPIKIPIPTNIVDLAVSDFDLDGFIDIVTITDNGDLYFYKNSGGAMLTSSAILANTILPNLSVHKIEVHDLNNDGLVDIIGSGQDFALGTFYAFTFQQSGTFIFLQMTPIPVFPGHNAQFNLPQTFFAFADFDADGFQDFVIGCEDLADTIEVYKNGGTTASINFTTAATSFTNPASGYTRYILAKDCNGDGMPDISIASDNGFSINKNMSSAMTFNPMMVDLSIFCQQFDFADMNFDNNKDLITSNYGSYNIHPGSSSSQIAVTGSFYNNFNLYDRRSFGLADFDGNAIPDLLFVGTGDAPYLQVSRNFSFHLKNVIVSTNTVLCGSNTVNFVVNNSHPSYPGIYNWTPGPATGITYTATSSGGVSCAFSFTLPPNLGQCTLYTDTINIISQTPPTGIINSSVSGVNCAGSTVSLIASVVPSATTYTWNTGATSSNIIVTPTVTTTYSLFMDDGCQDTVIYTVNVQPNPTVNITAPTTTICKGDSVDLTGNGAVNYTWYPSSQTSNIINVKPTATAVYSLVGSDSFGCSDTTSTTITVNNLPLVSIVPSKTLICFPDTVTLSATGASSYTWSTGSNSSSIPLLTF